MIYVRSTSSTEIRTVPFGASVLFETLTTQGTLHVSASFDGRVDVECNDYVFARLHFLARVPTEIVLDFPVGETLGLRVINLHTRDGRGGEDVNVTISPRRGALDA